VTSRRCHACPYTPSLSSPSSPGFEHGLSCQLTMLVPNEYSSVLSHFSCDVATAVRLVIPSLPHHVITDRTCIPYLLPRGSAVPATLGVSRTCYLGGQPRPMCRVCHLLFSRGLNGLVKSSGSIFVIEWPVTAK